MNIIFLGMQSSGKGAQAKLLSSELELSIVATGDIFRKKSKEGDVSISSYIDKGMLVPNEVTNAIVKEELSQEKYKNGVILDGYPRNISQAKTLDGYLNIDKVIFLDVPDEVVMKRIAGRRICESCGTVFNINSKLPEEEGVCNECKGKLVQRHDDTAEAIEKRLGLYHSLTKPLIEYYKEQGKLIYIDGIGSIEEVHKSIKASL